MFHVETVGTNLKLSGDAIVDENGVMIQINGQIKPATENPENPAEVYGYFNYAVNGDRANRSVDVPISYDDEANGLLTQAIAGIEAELRNKTTMGE
jgi:hypothetical protein